MRAGSREAAHVKPEVKEATAVRPWFFIIMLRGRLARWKWLDVSDRGLKNVFYSLLGYDFACRPNITLWVWTE